MKSELSKGHKKDIFVLSISFLLFLVFLILWWVTSDEVDYVDVPEKPFEEMTVAEKIESVRKVEEATTDDLNYRRALRSDNNYYCGLINNNTLRVECFEEVAVYEEIVVDTRSESEVSDNLAHRHALRSEDVSLCSRIVDEALRDSCVSELS